MAAACIWVQRRLAALGQQQASGSSDGGQQVPTATADLLLVLCGAGLTGVTCPKDFC